MHNKVVGKNSKVKTSKIFSIQEMTKLTKIFENELFQNSGNEQDTVSNPRSVYSGKVTESW